MAGQAWLLREESRILNLEVKEVELAHQSPIGRGNASKAEKKLGWKAKYHMEDIVRMMAEAAEHKKERIGR